MFRVLVLSLSVASISGLKVVNNVLSPTDIRGLEETKYCSDNDQTKSFLQLNKEILDQLNLKTPFVDNIQVQARSVSQTTRRHQDRHWGNGHIVQDDVAFVFLNSNPDAKFVYGDTEVNVEAGTLVQFRGDVPHHTQVQSGNVHLAGPFHMDSLKPVGEVIPFLAPVAVNATNAFWTGLGIILVTVFGVVAVQVAGAFE